MVVVLGLRGLGILAPVTLLGASLWGRGGHHRLVVVGLGGGRVFWRPLLCEVPAREAEVGTTGWWWWWWWVCGGWPFWRRLLCEELACGAEVGTTGWW